MIAVILVVAVVYGLVCGSFTAMVASSRGRDGVSWFVLGVLFGILALLAVGFMESKTNANQPKLAGWQSQPPATSPFSEHLKTLRGHTHGDNFHAHLGGWEPHTHGAPGDSESQPDNPDQS